MGTTTMRIVPLCWGYRDYSSLLAGSHHAYNGISIEKIGSPTTPHRISETFLYFSIVSFHSKWNRARLLSSEVKCKRCLLSCRTTEDWGSSQISKYQENWTKTAIKLSINYKLSIKLLSTYFVRDCRRDGIIFKFYKKH